MIYIKSLNKLGQFKTLVKLSFLLSFLFFSNFEAFSLDYDTTKYGAAHARSVGYVVIGEFDPDGDLDSLAGGGTFENSFFKTLLVSEVLKAESTLIGNILAGDYDDIGQDDVAIRVPSVFKLLATPDVLQDARLESRRLSMCRAVVGGTFIKHPNDNTLCESSIEEIDRKSSDPEFTSRAALGYYLERGWDFKFGEGKRYLLFLDRDDGQNFFYIKQPSDLVPLKGETLEEIQSILFPE